MNFDYERSLEPPAPTLPLLVGRPGQIPLFAINGLVDSGADISLLPEEFADALQLPAVGNIALADFAGNRLRVQLRAAGVGVENQTLVAEFACFGHEPLWGRNLINELVLTLDGPADQLVIGAAAKA